MWQYQRTHERQEYTFKKRINKRSVGNSVAQIFYLLYIFRRIDTEEQQGQEVFVRVSSNNHRSEKAQE